MANVVNLSDFDDSDTEYPEQKSKTLDQEIDNSERIIEDSENEMTDLEQQIKLLEETLVLYKENNDDHEANEHELKAAVKQLQGLLNEASDHGEQMQTELDEKENVITQLRQENDALKTKIKAMNKDVDNQIEIVIVENVTGYSKLEDKINELEDRFNQLKDTKDLTQKCCKQELELNAELDRCCRRIAEMEREKKDLRENINDKQSMIEALHVELRKRNDTIYAKDKEINKLNRNVVMEQRIRKFKSEEAKSFQLLASQFEEENLNLIKQNDQLKTEIQLQNSASESKAQMELKEALQMNNDLRSNHEQLTAELQTSEQKYSSVIQELALQKRRLKIVEWEVDELQKEKHSLAGVKITNKDNEQMRQLFLKNSYGAVKLKNSSKD